MLNSILWNLTLNIGFLVLIASLMTKNKIVQRMILEERGTAFGKVVLALGFGCFCILSTYTGIQLDDVIVNTRVIGALAAGLIGGPAVGVAAGIIGGVHRYLYDINGFTSVACAISTVAAGVFGAALYTYFQRGKLNNYILLLITSLTEGLHMGMILLICRPFEVAWNLVSMIALPMIFLNSLGMLIFISTFKNVFIERDREYSSKLSLALSVAEKCLPYLRKGISSRDDLKCAISVILSSGICLGVIISDGQQILAKGQNAPDMNIDDHREYAELINKVMESRTSISLTQSKESGSLKGLLRHYSIIAAPLIQMQQPVACLVVFVKRRWLNLEADTCFASGLATLFSTQLELSDIEYQKQLRQKAEYSALRAQVNPHFLYNSLNTVSCICRENPFKARELLLAMANYFRQTLESDRQMISLNEEISQIMNYLTLEKARFEEKLSVSIDIPEELDCFVPTLILQPIVENAVKYGADSNGYRRVSIKARGESNFVVITVSDSGQGFCSEALDFLNKNRNSDRHIGLTNVQNRLRSIYGEENSLRIKSSHEGSEVEIRIDGCPNAALDVIAGQTANSTTKRADRSLIYEDCNC